jgi:hypothetical protein
MSTLAHRSGLGGPENGGVAARRAVVRWAVRMFRREWRQQVLVLTLLTLAVAAAIGSITIAHNSLPANNGDFGSATSILMFDGSDPQRLQAGFDSAKKAFGTSDIIGHRSVHVPGSVETLDYRSQVPGGAYGGDLSRSAGAGTREAGRKSRRPREWRTLSGSRSARPWLSTGIDGPSWASSRTLGSSATSLL